MIPGVLKLGYTLESLGEVFSIQKPGQCPRRLKSGPLGAGNQHQELLNAPGDFTVWPRWSTGPTHWEVQGSGRRDERQQAVWAPGGCCREGQRLAAHSRVLGAGVATACH